MKGRVVLASLAVATTLTMAPFSFAEERGYPRPETWDDSQRIVSLLKEIRPRVEASFLAAEHDVQVSQQRATAARQALTMAEQTVRDDLGKASQIKTRLLAIDALIRALGGTVP